MNVKSVGYEKERGLQEDENLYRYLFPTGLLEEKYPLILHPIVKIKEDMPDVGKLHPFPAKLSITVQCGCILHSALTLQSTAVGYFSQENFNSCLEYREGRGIEARVDRQVNSS